MTNADSLSIILPARNEAASIGELVRRLRRDYPAAEVIVVDDGSTDGTGLLAAEAGARVLRHPYAKGNGAAIKAGARAAGGDLLLFMDADGQHDPAQIRVLLDTLASGYDMVVGARDRRSQASLGRWFANSLYNTLASWMVGHRIADLTSGFRVARARLFRQFLYLLPNGFSYPATSTMAFFRAGYAVAYAPIPVGRRNGGQKSHIRLLRDGARFLLIIFRVATLYSPLKLFFPISLMFFFLGAIYYLYTFSVAGQFTNLGALLFTTSILVFLIGLVSEQITALIYSRSEQDGTRAE